VGRGREGGGAEPWGEDLPEALDLRLRKGHESQLPSNTMVKDLKV